MNEEEKKAIEHLKVEREYAWDGDIIEIALNLIDKLEKENKEYIRIFNSTEKIMNRQERTIDKLKKENEDIREELQMYVDTPINKLIVENEELKEQRKELNLENQALYESINLEDSEYLAKKYQKLKKENEELTNELSKIQCDNRQLELELEKANKQMDLDYVDNNFISKDIIRNKIKELEQIEQQLEFIDNDSYARKRNKDFILFLKELLR